MTVTKSASQQICWGVNLPADLLTITKSARGISASRFTECHQISQSVNLLGAKSASRFGNCHQICQSVNLPVELGGKSASRFSDCYQICQSANLPAEMGVNLPADLVTVTKSASQQICQQKLGGKSASRFRDSHQFCQQIYPPISAGRSTDWQIW